MTSNVISIIPISLIVIFSLGLHYNNSRKFFDMVLSKGRHEKGLVGLLYKSLVPYTIFTKAMYSVVSKAMPSMVR